MCYQSAWQKSSWRSTFRPPDHIPKYFLALAFHSVAQGCHETLCEDQGRSILSFCAHMFTFPHIFVCLAGLPNLTFTQQRGQGTPSPAVWLYQVAVTSLFLDRSFVPCSHKTQGNSCSAVTLSQKFALFSLHEPQADVLPLSASVPGLCCCSWRAGVAQGRFFVTLLPHSCCECRALMLARFYLA